MFDNIKNLTGLLGQAKEFRAKLEQMQEELGRKTVEGEAGAGAVRVVVNGKFEVVSIRLDRPLLATLAAPSEEGGDPDSAMIEDLIASAVNAAMTKARDLVQQEMSKATGGLNLPGLDQITGQ